MRTRRQNALAYGLEGWQVRNRPGSPRRLEVVCVFTDGEQVVAGGGPFSLRAARFLVFVALLESLAARLARRVGGRPS